MQPSLLRLRAPIPGLEPAIRPVVRAHLRGARRPETTVRLARDLAWQWVASKWPRLLPSAAGMDSDHYARSAPGQKLVASTRADGDGWSLMVAFDERHGARTWITHVDIGQHEGMPALTLQTACTALPDARLVVAPPRLLGNWVERLDLLDGPVALISEPRLVTTPDQLDRFLDHVASPERALPIIAVSNRPGTRFFGVDPVGLATAIRGLAHVACLSPEVSDSVGERLGLHLGVVSGAARVYGAGVPIAASSQHHPLIRNHLAGGNTPANASAFRRMLCQRICALSVREPDESAPRMRASTRLSAGA